MSIPNSEYNQLSFPSNSDSGVFWEDCKPEIRCRHSFNCLQHSKMKDCTQLQILQCWSTSIFFIFWNLEIIFQERPAIQLFRTRARTSKEQCRSTRMNLSKRKLPKQKQKKKMPPKSEVTYNKWRGPSSKKGQSPRTSTSILNVCHCYLGYIPLIELWEWIQYFAYFMIFHMCNVAFLKNYFFIKNLIFSKQ